MIHGTAIVDARAQLDATVEVGPYAVIDAGVALGPHCVVGPHVHLTGQTVIGAHNRFHTGCVIGDAPQDLKYRGAETGLRIGDHNVFREQFTVHRANRPGEETVIGSHNFLMVNSHVGHNARLGDGIVLANGALIAGHVRIEDGAFISGNCLVHQFVRVGRLALMQGGAAISQDLPPFTVARGDNGLCGLNTVGLRRAGFTAAQRTELKRLYHRLFRGRGPLRETLEAARAQFTDEAARALLDFVAASRRGVCADLAGLDRRARRPGAEES
ncbi:MAG: acyl-ACP--UDP-N-acetylglucosamine O-acyltransferase [Verrucomicrobia bacterium]|nr:acyl-ACP--UDP-N-acetylglucosamine O-acyltransferase [Verrucomicrobiota bacterium]